MGIYTRHILYAITVSGILDKYFFYNMLQFSKYSAVYRFSYVYLKLSSLFILDF